MSNYNLNQIALFYIQILFSSSFLITILISISLSYNEILKFQNKRPLYTLDMEKNILLFNRFLSVLISLGFLWLNIQDRKYINDNINDIKQANLQIDASVLNLLGSLIALYIAFDNTSNLNSDNLTNSIM